MRVLVLVLKVCFHRNVNDAKCRKNGKSNIRILGSKSFATHARGFVHCSQGFGKLFARVVFSSAGISKSLNFFCKRFQHPVNI